MELTIKGKKYTIKYTIRALFIFEQITGKPFKIDTLLDNYLLFYSMILANNNNEVLDWDDFIDAIDSDKNLIEQLNEIISSYQKGETIFQTEDSDTGEKKI